MRCSVAERKTLETEITIKVDIDGQGTKNINTGIKFYDHMLEQLASHGYFDLDINVNSIDGDTHHTVEDVALTLGEAFRKALGDKRGINRYGNATIPMDESLVMTSIDLSGRPFCSYDVEVKEERVSDLDTVLVKHFFQSFSVASMSTIHIKLLNGEDPHHKIEAVFKSFARALNQACSINEKYSDIIPSTKGNI
ncbi:MAG: imidazoleglycerol-phosphate dehydratase HisB [bacterium]